LIPQKDAAIAYTDIRYTFSEYPTTHKETTIKSLNPMATLPVVELNGKVLTGSYPMLRRFSRLLGGMYDGETEEEKYFVDVICDLVVDCT
jgi:glutathione S-transferase